MSVPVKLPGRTRTEFWAFASLFGLIEATTSGLVGASTFGAVCVQPTPLPRTPRRQVAQSREVRVRIDHHPLGRTAWDTAAPAKDCARHAGKVKDGFSSLGRASLCLPVG